MSTAEYSSLLATIGVGVAALGLFVQLRRGRAHLRVRGEAYFHHADGVYIACLIRVLNDGARRTQIDEAGLVLGDGSEDHTGRDVGTLPLTLDPGESGVIRYGPIRESRPLPTGVVVRDASGRAWWGGLLGYPGLPNNREFWPGLGDSDFAGRQRKFRLRRRVHPIA